MSPESAQIASSRRLSASALAVILRPYVLAGGADLVRRNALRSLREEPALPPPVPNLPPDPRATPERPRRDRTPPTGSTPWAP